MAWTRSACPCLRGQQLTKMERRKIINICPSFSEVTNKNISEVMSALSDVVSLVSSSEYPANFKLIQTKAFAKREQLYSL